MESRVQAGLSIMKIGIVRNIASVAAVATAHGIGSKKVLLGNDETETRLAQIAVTKLSKGEQSEIHVHPTMEECFLIVEGEVSVQVESQQLQLHKGDFIQVMAGQPHGIKALTDAAILTIGCATTD